MHGTASFGQTALITGGSRGIGAAIAERLAQDGFSVMINYASSEPEANEVVNRIENAGGMAIPVQGDVSNPAAVRRMFDIAECQFGGLDVLVNSAGLMKLATLAETDDALFNRHIDINLRGTFNTLREAAKRLRDGGCIVNLSSSVVGLYQPTYATYAATKAGVEAMTRVMAKELRGRNISINAVAPGPTATSLFLDGKPKAAINALANLSPLERLGLPEDIAATVSFLASSGGRWIHGQVVRANGGVI
ncbi:SDR family oxidoreductase [Tardiphaga alba]|uniref:SDR family oxidoreductase n=2 Tax=Tardiphaga alba TaxID=340268 RepID=A0ABX8AFT5_9BRAD|nr:SDR family oxidoreductase [Tardiphaga alba]